MLTIEPTQSVIGAKILNVSLAEVPDSDVVLWDNRRVLHAGTPYDVKNTRRLMYRTTFRETKVNYVD